MDLRFKADNTTGPGTLWWMVDANDNRGEYRLVLEGNTIRAFLGDGVGYQVNWTLPFAFTDTANWHTLGMAWKQGQDTLITFDGTTYNVANAFALNAFTSNDNVLGGLVYKDIVRTYYYDGHAERRGASGHLCRHSRAGRVRPAGPGRSGLPAPPPAVRQVRRKLVRL